MSDSTPTVPLPSPAAPPASPPTEAGSRRTLIILISVAGALLLAIIILLVVLFGRGGDQPAVVPTDSSSPSASATPTPTETTPSATPTATETEAPPTEPDPEPEGPIESFTASATKVNCDGASSVPVHFSWSAEGDQLWFGVGTNNAKNAPYDSFPLVYDFDFDYQCGQSNKKQTYTITVEIGNDLFSETITVKE